MNNPDAPMNISSLVVRAEPEHVKKTAEALRMSGLCDVCFHDASGTIIVTIEGRDVSEEMRKLEEIQAVEHVISAGLAYSCSENEAMEDIGNIEGPGGTVPASLDPHPEEAKGG